MNFSSGTRDGKSLPRESGRVIVHGNDHQEGLLALRLARSFNAGAALFFALRLDDGKRLFQIQVRRIRPGCGGGARFAGAGQCMGRA